MNINYRKLKLYLYIHLSKYFILITKIDKESPFYTILLPKRKTQL